MDNLYARRMRTLPRSFIREILKVTEEPSIISFAGGLPNPALFPVAEFGEAAARVFAEDGRRALQYSTTEGYRPLREFIAARYLEKKGMVVDPDEILITNGSQQGLDLIGKVLLDQGDVVLLERPSYLGAIQAFSMYEPQFRTVPLLADGPDLDLVEDYFRKERVKLFYSVPNFQNPSGISYSASKRRALASLLGRSGVVFVEDDPYGELRFLGEDLPPVTAAARERGVLLGSFSKIVAPGIRLGWIFAPAEIMKHLVTVKQGTDLHSNYLAQRILHRFLLDFDLDRHVATIRAAYRTQRDAMVARIDEARLPDVTRTEPEGGMFLWLTLPERLSSMELFERAIRKKVAFVPGAPFYVDGGGANTLRLNFSNSSVDQISAGVHRLGEAIAELSVTVP